MRLRALVLAVPLIVLAACSSGTETTGTEGTGASGSSTEAPTPGPTVPPATALAAPVAADQLPTVVGEFGTTPTMTFPTNDPVPSLQRVVLSEGTGPVTQKGDWLVVNYIGQIWGGEVFDNSFDKGQTFSFQASDQGQVVPGWKVGMIGVPVGSRVMLSLPPADGYGPTGNPSAGISGTDTLVFIVDIVQAIPVTAGGQPDAAPAAPLPANGPQVGGALGAAATVTIPAGSPEPTTPTVTVLATGTGAPIALGQVLAQFTAVNWTGEPVFSTWPGADPAQGGTGPQELPVATGGPFAGLVGVPIGSRVLVQVPAQSDEQSGQSAPSIAAAVDLLFQTAVTPATTASSAAPTS